MRLAVLYLAIITIATPAFAEPDFSRWEHRVSSVKDGSIVQNQYLALWFPKDDSWFKEARIYAHTPQGGRLMAVSKPFFRLSYLDQTNTEQSFDLAAERVEKRMMPDGRIGLEFVRNYTYAEVTCTMQARVLVAEDEPLARVECTISASGPMKLTVFRPLTLLVGEDSFGTAKDEAIFPGLEYLSGQESSSSKLDVTSKERRRYAPHPYKITVPLMAVQHEGYLTGILWDANQRWDGQMECPSTLFASPNFLQNGKNHLMGLYLPSYPWVEEYKTRATTPYPLEPGKELKLSFQILVRPARYAVDAVDNWIRVHGVPAPPEKPRSWQEEASLSLSPYVTAIWRDGTEGFGWVPWAGAKPTVSPEICSLLMLGAEATQDKVLAGKLRDRAIYAASKALKGGAASLEFAYRFGPLDASLDMLAKRAADIIASQKPDGSWVFDPPKGKTVLGVPVESLGERGESSLGTTAEPAAFILRYARVTGDVKMGESGLKALKFMDRFIRPQGAQVWECPLHAPDLLAAAYAADAYLQGYLLSGDQALLVKARYWARTGLPFVYFWGAEDRSMMRCSTIGVFGASVYTWAWFGRPVQRNGLVYADVIRRLAPHDKTFDWRTFAKGIIIAAMQQQGTTGENKGLLPDSWHLLDDEPEGPWVHPGQHLLANVLGIIGQEHEIRTRVIGTDEGRIFISAAADIDASIDHARKLVRFRLSGGLSSMPLLASVTGLPKPVAVHWNGLRIAEGTGGWTYRDGRLLITGASSGSGKVQLTYSSLAAALPAISASVGPEIKFSALDPVAGQNCLIQAKVTNRLKTTVRSISIAPKLPAGWKGSAWASVVKELGPGESAGLSWDVTPPLDSAGSRVWFAFESSYLVDGREYASKDGITIKPILPVTVSDVGSDVFSSGERMFVKKLIRLKNTCGKTVECAVSLKLPEGWGIKSRTGTTLSLAPGAYKDMDAEFISPEHAAQGHYKMEASVFVDGIQMPAKAIDLEIPVLCRRTSGSVRVDGDLSDWEGRMPVKISSKSDLSDLSGRMGVMWDDNHLYLAFSITDDLFLQRKEGAEIWRQDSIQVAFDTLRDRSAVGYEADDYEYNFALTPSEILCWRSVCPSDKLIGRVKTQLAIVRSGKKTEYEIALRWADLEPFVPKAGRTMGFAFLVNDDDGSGRSTAAWGGGMEGEKQPAKFVGLRLVGK